MCFKMVDNFPNFLLVLLEFTWTTQINLLWFIIFKLNKKAVILDFFPYNESNSRYDIFDNFFINISIMICFCYATEDGFNCKKLFRYFSGESIAWNYVLILVMLFT